jgi:hypothetical protein
MFTYYIRYKTISGEILNKMAIPNEDSLISQPKEVDESIAEINPVEYSLVSPAYYYKKGLQSRPIMEILNTGLNFTNIPTDFPITLSINNTTYPVTEDNVDLNIDTPGTYIVIFTGFPYINKIFKVVV